MPAICASARCAKSAGSRKWRARKNIPMEQLRPAHYALCASLDDVVLATPWGSQGAWAQRSLVSTFHQEVRSGERFFDVLAQLRQNPGEFPAGAGADVFLPLARLYGPLPAVAARPGGNRQAAGGHLRGHPPPAAGGRRPGCRRIGMGVAAPYRREAVFACRSGSRRSSPSAFSAAVYALVPVLAGRPRSAQFEALVTAPPAAMPQIMRAAPVVAPAEPAPRGPDHSGPAERLPLAGNRRRARSACWAPSTRRSSASTMPGLFGSRHARWWRTTTCRCCRRSARR